MAAAKITFAMALFSVSSAVTAMIAGLLSFAIYNGNKLADLDEDQVNCPQQARFVLRHARGLALAATLAGAAAIVIATAIGGPVAGAVVLAPAVAGVLYSLPIAGQRRLKDVYVVNTALVAIAWAIPIAVLPAVMAGDSRPVATAVVLVYFFLRTFISVEVFNVRDVAGDRAAGIDTLPVRLGISGTQIVLLALDVASLAFITAAGPAVGLSETVVLAAIPVTGLSMGLTVLLAQCRNWKLVCFAKDCEYLVMGLAGLAALA